MKWPAHTFLAALLLFCVLSPELKGQVGCEPPPLPPLPQGVNIFSDEQEVILGEVIAAHVERDFRVIDDEIADHLQLPGERITRQLPQSSLRFRFFLVDLPRADAFTLPGGRIYVTRKLVAFAHSEDELAGILAHEAGHVLVHHPAISASQAYLEVLGVRTVGGDRQDILEKYNRLLEAPPNRLKRLGGDKNERFEGQLAADQIAMHAMTQAGYSPQAFVDVFDRLAQTEGKKGNWFTDLFGATRPESRRLRELAKTAAGVPKGCIETSQPTEEFNEWQAAVIDYAGLGRREALHGILLDKKLNPPLGSDVSHFRFSPDGKHLLAQDDSSIYVISREPFVFLFRIDALDAYPAQFTPDSRSIVFHTPALRVQIWDVDEERRVSAHELVVQDRCYQSTISPDGGTLACLGVNFDLKLIALASGKVLFSKKDFFILDFFTFLFFFRDLISHKPVIPMAFSPDNQYFLAAWQEKTVALNLSTMEGISLPGRIKGLLPGGFAFIGPDRLAGIRSRDLEKSALVRFPSGELISHLLLAHQWLIPPGHGDYLILSPVNEHPVGIMNLEMKKILIPNRSRAADIYDGIFVRQDRDGGIGLYDVKHLETNLRRIRPPTSRLGRLRAFALSPGMKWLAISHVSRGGIWDLSSGARVDHTCGFAGAHFNSAGRLFADFPKFEKLERSVYSLSYPGPRETRVRKIEAEDARQYGRYLLDTLKPDEPKSRRPPGLEIRDIETGGLLWTREFAHDFPTLYIAPRNETMVCVWDAEDREAKEKIKRDPRRQDQLGSRRAAKWSHLAEVLRLSDGKQLGRLVVGGKESSFALSQAFAVEDFLVVTDRTDRILVFSLSGGQLVGHTFGLNPVFAKDASLMSVEDGPGVLSIYDLPSLKKVDQFFFCDPISAVEFCDGGKQLFVLTADQNAYLLELTAAHDAASDATSTGLLDVGSSGR